MTPVRAWLGPHRFAKQAGASVAALDAQEGDDEHSVRAHLDDIDRARREVLSPVERLQHALHGWVAFGIMPLFALANAGVPLGGASFTGESLRVFCGVIVGLGVGKPLGILGLSWICVRAGVAALPRGVTWSQVGLVGLIGGIGFTMALFIAQLALPEGALLETAKLGILTASAVAAGLAYTIGRMLLSATPSSAAARTLEEAEASTAV